MLSCHRIHRAVRQWDLIGNDDILNCAELDQNGIDPAASSLQSYRLPDHWTVPKRIRRSGLQLLDSTSQYQPRIEFLRTCGSR